jgi:hypothetical protein
MALVRRWTTDQDLLQRAHADQVCLRRLLREAKARRDRPTMVRIRASLSGIAVKLLAAEGRPLLAAIVPIALLGTWAWFRLGHVPPRVGEPIVVELSLPADQVGELVWLLPQPGLEVQTPPVQEVAPATTGGTAYGAARWTVAGTAGRHRLICRGAAGSWEHPLDIGRRTYTDPVRCHTPDQLLPQTHVQFAVPPILGFLPGPRPESWGGWGAMFPSWVITYVLLVLPLFILGKRVFRLR